MVISCINICIKGADLCPTLRAAARKTVQKKFVLLHLQAEILAQICALNSSVCPAVCSCEKLKKYFSSFFKTSISGVVCPEPVINNVSSEPRLSTLQSK